MQTGRQTLSQIEGTISELRRSENQVDGALRSAEAEVARLRQERGETLRALARVKLDALQQGEVIGPLDGAERNALRLIEEHRSEIAAMAERLKTLSLSVEKLEQDRHAKAADVEAAVDGIEKLTASVEAKLASQAEWKRARDAGAQAATIAAAAEKKAADAEAELGEKKKPYDEDRLFQYLWKRRFGTGDYAGGGLSRFMDRWLAGHIEYEPSRISYGKLIEIPPMLRSHADTVKADASAAADSLARIERKALVDGGIEPLEKELARARAALAEAEKALAAEQAELKAAEERRESALSEEGTDSYREAIRILAENDARDTIRQLYAEAGRTKAPDDDRLVERIEKTDVTLGASEQEVQNIRKQALEIAHRRSEVETVRERFRDTGYDHPNVVFSNNSMIGDLLSGILRGAVQGAILWDTLERSHEVRYPRNSDFGGGISFPMPRSGGGGWSPGSGGGSWSGGGGGGRGGGGFSTGGGF